MKIKENKVNVISLGCSKNTVDSERLLNQLRLNDFQINKKSSGSDVVVINTCGFIDAAKEESVNTILEAVELKKKGKSNKIIVAGCLSERYKDDLRKEIPEVDSFFGTEAYNEILNDLGGKLKYELLGERMLTTPKHSVYLKISEGCNHPCSFCAIPIMRGGHKTTSMEDLVKEAGFLAQAGAKELVIIGQDTTDYGIDLYGERKLAELLQKLSDVNGIEWIRLMYAYPSHFPDDVIEVIAGNPKICKYVDIPLQHISDKVLKSMRRGVTAKQTYKLLEKLRTKVKDIAIRTTFITGYPNETEADFKELCNFISEMKFDRLGAFTFSQEENTSSFILGDPYSAEVKEERKNILMEIQKDISLNNNSKMVDRTLKVLIDRREGDFYIGRSYKDAPEVDGEILINMEKHLSAGKFYNILINDYNEYDLMGKKV